MMDNPEPETISFLDAAIVIMEKALADLKALRSRANIETPLLHNTNKLINQIAKDLSDVKRAVI